MQGNAFWRCAYDDGAAFGMAAIAAVALALVAASRIPHSPVPDTLLRWRNRLGVLAFAFAVVAALSVVAPDLTDRALAIRSKAHLRLAQACPLLSPARTWYARPR